MLGDGFGRVWGGFGEVFGRVWELFERSRGLSSLFSSFFGYFLAVPAFFFCSCGILRVLCADLGCFLVVFGFLLSFADLCWVLLGFAEFSYCWGRAKRASKASERSSLALCLGFP